MLRQLAVSALLLAVPSSALTQDLPPPADVVIEGFPDYVAARFKDDTLHGAAGQAEKGWLNIGRRWEPGARLRVCFQDGSRDLRRKIADIASQWNSVGANISLDFGNMSDPRLCDSQFSSIRVGYSMHGYWSFVGKDSIYYAPQHEQSLNLARFNWNPPEDAEFQRVVLHEFGHALGFNHEHQSPGAGCEDEFNWDAIYTYLSRSPNFWKRETVDHNMRAGKYYAGDTVTVFDRQSIMLYSFPVAFYRRGAESKCFAPTNTTLSEADKAAARLAYPTGNAGLIERAGVLGEAWLAASDGATAAAIRHRIEFYAVPSTAIGEAVQAGAIAPEGAVIDLPRLSGARDNALARILAASDQRAVE